MKSYIKKVIIFVSLVSLLIVVFWMFRIVHSNQISWKLPEDTHILFMGSSHIQRGINDSVFHGSINLAEGSERYLFTYLKMGKLIEENPKVDTVFLQFAPTDIWKDTDTKYYMKNEISKFLPLYLPFFSSDEFKVYAKMNLSEILTLLIQKSLKKIPTSIYSFGKYLPSDRVFTNFEDPKMPLWLKKGHDINYEYLDKIISLCKEKEIKLFLLYMPMYNPREFYDLDYFYKVYEEKFSEIEFLDYNNWDCPNNFRGDEHHLNKVGANVFTEELYTEISGLQKGN